MIIYGPSGTGKSAAVNIYCRQVLGEDYSTNFKLINVRELMTYPLTLAKRSLQEVAKVDPELRSDLDEYMSLIYQEAQEELKMRGQKGTPNRTQLLQMAIRVFSSSYTLSEVPVKILVLDEADAMNSSMQQALRRTMEIYGDVSRFIFITQSLAGWSPAVLSRSLVLRFQSPPKEAITGLLRKISQNEGVNADDVVLSTIAKICHGDVRRAINLLQMASAGVDRVTEDEVYKVSQTPLEHYVHNIITLAFNGEFVRARKMLRELLTIEGYEPVDVIRQIERDILIRPLDHDTRAVILKRIADIDSKLNIARNPYIHLTALITSIIRISAEFESNTSADNPHQP